MPNHCVTFDKLLTSISSLTFLPAKVRIHEVLFTHVENIGLRRLSNGSGPSAIEEQRNSNCLGRLNLEISSQMMEDA